jgi:hypothetical protein
MKAKKKSAYSRLSNGIDSQQLANAMQETDPTDLYGVFGQSGPSAGRVACGHLLPVLTKMRNSGVRLSAGKVADKAQEYIRAQGNPEFILKGGALSKIWKDMTGMTFSVWAKAGPKLGDAAKASVETQPKIDLPKL